MNAATVAIDGLCDTLRNRRALVPFSEVLRALETVQGEGHLAALVGHPKLTGRPSTLTIDDFLIFERFSFSILHGELQRLGSIPEHERLLWAQDVDKQVNHRTDFVRVYSSGCFEGIADHVVDLLHLFFVTTEYDKLVTKSAKTVARSLASEDRDGAPRYDQLIEANWARHGLKSSFFRLNSDEDFERFLGEYPADDDLLIPDLRILMHDSIRSRQSLNGEVTINGVAVFVRTIPLRRHTSRKAHGCFVMFSEGVPVPAFAVAVNELVVDRYNEVRVSGAQAAAQVALQLSVIRATKIEELNVQTAQRDFLKVVAKKLILTTHAHSVTIRKYSSFTDSLELVSSDERPVGGVQHAEGLVVSNALPTIECSATNSVNGFCYKKIRDTDAVYIPDVDNIPENYRASGLADIKRWRPGTKSELCVPIIARKLRYGTLNLEAPFAAAFEFDVDYVKSISYLVSQYLDILGSGQDSWWLSHLSFTHLATHELKDFKQSLNTTQQERLERIIYTLSPQNLYSSAKGSTLGEVIELMRQAHSRMTAQIQFDSVWKYPASAGDIRLPQRFISSLYLILLSVLNNTRHSKYETDVISVTLVEYSRQPLVLRVDYSSGYAVVDPENLVGMFDVPNINSDGWHFGLFLIGVHCRLLGGHVEVNPECYRDDDYAKFSFRIDLPIEGEE